jgi:hypothetical protein
MSNEASAPIIIEIAKGFITLIRGIRPDWQKAYLRFSDWDAVIGAKASYVHPAGVELVDVLQHKAFFHDVQRRGRELLDALEKQEGVFLLSIASDFKYKFDFEWEAKDRWRISKLSGGTGIPEGLE